MDAFDKLVAKTKLTGPIGEIQFTLDPIEDLSLLLSSKMS